jgi:hypothetical protein
MFERLGTEAARSNYFFLPEVETEKSYFNVFDDLKCAADMPQVICLAAGQYLPSTRQA